jgi:hypothetical protein
MSYEIIQYIVLLVVERFTPPKNYFLLQNVAEPFILSAVSSEVSCDVSTLLCQTFLYEESKRSVCIVNYGLKR